MDENYFEGTLILEKLAEIDKVDNFFEAIDSDNFKKAEQLMRLAGIDLETIQKAMNQLVNELS